ncbi:MAG: CRISPR-associated helicase Cas3', partial [Haloechinothrix sp.]
MLGPKRGLLIPITIGTVDQLLHAATRTRHVMLRHAGLAGRVVVLDEVHAYDVYMSQFLFEALRWLADAGVPVVLLSATLPPAMRADLVRAYLQGAGRERDIDVDGLPQAVGYPNTLTACLVDATPQYSTRSSEAWRPSARVAVEVLQEEPNDGPERVVGQLAEALAEGGCALVVRNTVRRAQDTFTAVKEKFGDDAILLHAGLVMGQRTERVERVLDLLGRPGHGDGSPRPRRLVVVATQLAEQSFDVDVDLLITDLGPIDLLLQRIGRLHRHDRADEERPPLVRSPRAIIAGVAFREDAPPVFPPGSTIVYGDRLLLRSAALVLPASAGSGWSVPEQVPDLVRRGYGDEQLVADSWLGAAERAQADWLREQATRTANAQRFLLAGPDDIREETLAGLHDRSTADLDDDEVAAVVRDGDPSVEVVLVRHDGQGYLTLNGRPLGATGEAVSEDVVLEEVVQSTVRLPARAELTKAALKELRPLPGWGIDPW